MNSSETTKFVIERLTKLDCPPLAKVESITIQKKAKSYKLLSEDPQITLEEYLEKMEIENE